MADRDFKGVWIPKEIWLDKSLSMLEKGILTEIDSLDNGEDGCWASNAYLAKFCQCTERKVTDAISKLIGKGYLKVISFDGRQRKLRSCIEKISMQGGNNFETDTKKIPPINTSNSTDSNTIISISHNANELAGFNDFWKIYPNKVKRKDSFTAWRAGKCEKIADTIIADVKRRLDSEWKGDGARFVPHPTTYIHGRRWEDEPSTTTPQPSPSPEPLPAFMTHEPHKEYSPDERKAMYREMGFKVD